MRQTARATSRAPAAARSAVTCDVTDERQVIAAVAAAREAFGGIDILVNNAAIFNKKGVLDMPLDEWQRQLEIILGGTFLFTKHVAKSMIEQRRKGTIINIISTAGHQGEPNNIAYCTGKSGLLNFTRSAAMELVAHGIRVNSLTPTATDPIGIARARRAMGPPSSQRRRSTQECVRAVSQRRADAKAAESERLRASRGFSRVGRRRHDHGDRSSRRCGRDRALLGVGSVGEVNRLLGEAVMDKSADSYIMDDQDAGLFRVNRRAFTDPECLADERRRIFDKCWIYVGHESEVPHAGDYRSRNVAGRPMILVRGDDSVVRVLLNTCTHRGSLVCRQKSGNAKTFQCPYHAWTFNSRGQLVGVPGEDSYSDAFKREDMGLAAAAAGG